MSLENDIFKIESITQKIESENLSVDEILNLYEEAILISKQCLTNLSSHKGRLTELNSSLEKIIIEDYE
ncbi:MAG: exodeoxyribonuclease VII small subunit [Firmicutes bacterium ADurb.Bin080]|jgi:exodeoxyribonuclease VII small subunit|nr:exodeoxyribonuclease VII small subunit [Clostridiales bacterium]OQC16440.1 MAG: exodeoxyribonuclease VII small subunit [Firmicutes bacterium ADurb.Bin080]